MEIPDRSLPPSIFNFQFSIFNLQFPLRRGACYSRCPEARWPASAAEKPAAEKPAAAGDLVGQQEAVAAKYDRLEKWLLEMAELSMAVDPERHLLRKAITRAKTGRSWAGWKNRPAAEEGTVGRRHRGRGRRDRECGPWWNCCSAPTVPSNSIRRRPESAKYIKQISTLLNQQRDVQGRTDRAGNPTQLAEEAGQLPRRPAPGPRDQGSGRRPRQAARARAKNRRSSQGAVAARQGPSGQGTSGQSPSRQRATGRDKAEPSGKEPSRQRAGRQKPRRGRGNARPNLANRDRVNKSPASSRRKIGQGQGTLQRRWRAEEANSPVKVKTPHRSRPAA